ncbi:MAG: 4Fe-4S cluster-binding domain-containing protein [Phycisphaerae bacterium]|nr:4Fe-4S cluster-binding domain-containing protein [Phycisphaerae bacterium]
MYELNDNLFNHRRQRHQPKLKRWRYAGLILTYRCTAACRFCYYSCSPQATGLMSAATAIEAWEGLVRIAGENAKVHITGGEPFLYFERLSEIAEQAHQLKLTGLDSVETNADWGENEREISDKLKFLDSVGLDRLKISWDPFHEEFVEFRCVQRLSTIARKVLGPERVLIRWEHYLTHPSGIRSKNEPEKHVILQEALKSDPCRFTGRAAETLGQWTAQYPVEYFQRQQCQNALLSAKGVHIDPYGNVFNGQCSGMVIGNITQKPLDALWKTWQPDQDEFWKILYLSGPCGFIDQACGIGYPLREKYASKCHLCTDIRRFFFDKSLYSPIITPKDCYGKY